MAMFDAAHNRLSYSELLMPEPGYALDFAVGLTYSLDLEALLGIPVSLGLLEEADSDAMKSPFYLLEAIRKSSDNIAIFCNAGGIALPQKIQSVYSLLENSVFEVKLKNKQNFHPKLWFIKYKSEDDKAYIKLLVLSRNLTFDNSIDLCICLQGEIMRTKRKRNQPLADMLEFVAGYADKKKRQRILTLAEEILHIKNFDIEHPFEDYEFLPLGIDNHDKEQTKLFDHKYDIFAVSPFLSDDIIRELSKCPYNKVLVTRKASVTALVLKSFDAVYITKEVLNDNEYGIKQDIHAKLYFTVTAQGNYLYIGSANASHNAFHNNVEFLIKLKYNPNCVGFKTFFGDFIPEENCPYERIENIPEVSEPDILQDSIDKAFKETVYALIGGIVIKNGNTYDIQIDSKQLKTSENVKISPLQRPDIIEDVKSSTLLKGLLLKELSEFYILTIQGQRIVIKLETKGIPAERDNAVYKSIIDSKGKFLSYVSFMLSEDYQTGILDATENLRLMQEIEPSEGSAALSTGVYEKMLRILHQNPARIKELSDVIKRLDSDIVGDDFMAMYSQFEMAARRLKK